MTTIDLIPRPCKTCGQPVLLEPHTLQWIDPSGSGGCGGDPAIPHAADIEPNTPDLAVAVAQPSPSAPQQARRGVVLVVCSIAVVAVAAGIVLATVLSLGSFRGIVDLAGTKPTMVGPTMTPSPAKSSPPSSTTKTGPTDASAPVLCDPELPGYYCFPRDLDPHAALARIHGMACGTPPPLQDQVQSDSPFDGTDVEECTASTVANSTTIGYSTDNYQASGSFNDIDIDASASSLSTSGPPVTFQDAERLEDKAFAEAVYAFWPNDATARDDAMQSYHQIITRCNTPARQGSLADAASATMSLGYVVSCAPATPIAMDGPHGTVTTITVVVDIRGSTPK
jgi:hypothetical protein